MKVNLISFFNRFNEYPTKYSLGTLKLAAYLGTDKDLEIEIVPIDSDQPLREDTLQRILYNSPQIVGLPNFMWTENLAQQISKAISEKASDTLITVGGPSTSTTNLSKWNHNEIFILGEGEIALKEICLAKKREPTFCSKDLERLSLANVFSEHVQIADKNVVYKGTQIPKGLPLFSDELEEMKQDKSGEEFAWYETTRGCAYSCGYCGHKTRNNLGDVDMDNIREEINNIKKRGIKRIFIVDPIIGGKKRKGKEILQLCHDKIPDVKIIAYLRPEMLDDEFVRLLEQANLEEMRFGIQTLNPNVPSWIRSNNINRIKTELSKLKGKNINWRAELITGLPGDDLEGIEKTTQFVIDAFQPTVLASYHLTAIKGTKLYSLVGQPSSGQFLKCNKDSQAVASYSYSEEEFKRMAAYSNATTGLYNLLKKLYPQKIIDYKKLQQFILLHIGKVDPEKIISFDDEYNQSFWEGELKGEDKIDEKVSCSKTWGVDR